MIRRRRAEAVLAALIAALAAALLMAGIVAVLSQRDSLPQEAAWLGAPQLIAVVPPGDGARVTAALGAASDVERVGAPVLSADGSVRAGSRNAPAQIVAVGTALPTWLDLVSGRPPAAGAADVVLEKGAAAALHVRAGDTVLVAGSAGEVRAVVTGIAGDLSRATYPLTTPAAVYAAPAVARATGVAGDPQQSAFGIWLRPGASAASLVRAFLRAVPPGQLASLSAIDSAEQSLSVITDATTGGVLAFGIAAFLCLVIFTMGAARVDVLRRERWIGELRATGWTTRQLRAVLLLASLPALAAGALAGVFAGALTGRLLAGQVSALYGAPAATTGIWPAAAAVWVLVIALAAAASWAATRGLARQQPASQLARASGISPGRGRGAPDIRRGAAPMRVSGAMAAARRARSLTTIALVAAATATAVFAAATAATLNQFTSDPRQWGYNYDLRVELPTGASATAASDRVAGLAGVAAAAPTFDGSTQLAGFPSTVSFTLLPAGQTLMTPRALSGQLPQTAGEVALGSALASQLGARVGTVLRLVPSQTRLKVVGITREISNQGSILRGTLGLRGTLARQITDAGILVRVAAGSSAETVTRRIESASGGRWAVTNVLADISLPFASVIRAALALLAATLLLLAAAMAARTAMITSEESVPTYGLLKAVGADRRQLTSMAMSYTAILIAPGALLGLGLGVLAARAGIAALGSSVGGLVPDLPVALIAVAVGVAALGPALGLAMPVLRAARRTPASSLDLQI